MHLMSDRHDGLAMFGARLAHRRSNILEDWKRRVAADPRLLTGNTLPAAQLHDHLTALLEDFERRLHRPDAADRALSEDAQSGDAAAHGLHRWQQGFDLAELVRELGRLNESVIAEIHRCGTEPGLLAPALLAEVEQIWAALFSVAISSSAEQYFKLQQLEAAGHVGDLEHALDDLRSLEAQRATLWQEAAHDLRGNLSVVSLVSSGLNSGAIEPAKTARFLVALARNVSGLQTTLQDVTSLARLQGGKEVRSLEEIDIAKLLRDLVDATLGLAQDRHLYLHVEGPDAFMVQGDVAKIRRIVQNLALNAIRYTERGGVTIHWDRDPAQPDRRWFIAVADTGPGIHAGPGSPLADAINVASEQARQVVKAEGSGEVLHVTSEESVPESKEGSPQRPQKSGEGLGLSIVKRLCTLLDATIEVESRPDVGTTFRILFPLQYEA